MWDLVLPLVETFLIVVLSQFGSRLNILTRLYLIPIYVTFPKKKDIPNSISFRLSKLKMIIQIDCKFFSPLDFLFLLTWRRVRKEYLLKKKEKKHWYRK